MNPAALPDLNVFVSRPIAYSPMPNAPPPQPLGNPTFIGAAAGGGSAGLDFAGGSFGGSADPGTATRATAATAANAATFTVRLMGANPPGQTASRWAGAGPRARPTAARASEAGT